MKLDTTDRLLTVEQAAEMLGHQAALSPAAHRERRIGSFASAATSAFPNQLSASSSRPERSSRVLGRAVGGLPDGRSSAVSAASAAPSGRWQARYPGPDGIDRPAPDTFATKTDADSG